MLWGGGTKPPVAGPGWCGDRGAGQAGEAALLSALVSRVTVTTADLCRCAEC